MVTRPAYIEDRNPAIPIGALVNAFGAQDPEVSRLLGPDGPIARGLPGYRPRTQQVQFAQAVARSLKAKKVLTAEAGTGVGKSLGYLAPAIAWADRTGERVVVGTATLALQDQLRMKDLPFLERYLGIDFSWAVLKGRTNYACRLKLEEETAPLEFQAEWDEVQAWLKNTRTGDIGELSFDLKRKDYSPLRGALCIDEDDCPGKKCRFSQAGKCHFYRARDRAATSQVLVVNHALLVLDLVLGGQLLPAHSAVILDEAHQFESYCRNALERSLTEGRFRKLLKRLGQFCVERMDSEQIRLARESIDHFFRVLGNHVRQRLRGQSGKMRLNEVLPEEVLEASKHLVATMEEGNEHLRLLAASLDEEDPLFARTESLYRNIHQAQEDLRALAAPADSNTCLWSEAPADLDSPVTLTSTPISVAPFLKGALFTGRSPRIPVILCSATLATSRDEKAFDLVSEALGIEHPLTLQVDSPYNYQSQALWYLPELPLSILDRQQGEDYQAQAGRFADAITPEIERVLHATQGRAFVLFTSYQVLRQVRLRLRVSYPVKTQEDGTKGALVDWFKSEENPVLLATSSFWEGVDIPGQSLSCVIIDKIPFASPSDPVEQAIQEKLGRQAFFQRNLPTAVMMLKQGVGRLIRTETDRGLIVLLDPRFRGKSYGRKILDALPGSPEPDVTTLDPAFLNLVADFIAGRAVVA